MASSVRDTSWLLLKSRAGEQMSIMTSLSHVFGQGVLESEISLMHFFLGKDLLISWKSTEDRYSSDYRRQRQRPRVLTTPHHMCTSKCPFCFYPSPFMIHADLISEQFQDSSVQTDFLLNMILSSAASWILPFFSATSFTSLTFHFYLSIL